jgi:hypothetical protein
MTQDVSGFGTLVNLVASNTFPASITITAFSDDADAIDLNSIDIAESAMGLNGDLIKWSKANALPFSINVIPGSPDDENLAVLAEANRVGQGKNSAQDIITITIIYPNGNTLLLSGGFIKNAMFGNSVAGSGRQKTKKYDFVFQNKIETFLV